MLSRGMCRGCWPQRTFARSHCPSCSRSFTIMRAILLYSSMMLLASGTSTVEDNQEPVTVHNLSAPSGDAQYTAAISAAMTAMEARVTATYEAKLTAVETVEAKAVEAKAVMRMSRGESSRGARAGWR